MADTNNTFEYSTDNEYLNKKINVIPKPTPEIGIDVDDAFLALLLDSGIAGNGLNISKLNSFCNISLNRNSVYDLIDTMLEDPTIAAVIEIYCEDATEANDKGLIIWVESADKNVSTYVNYLLQDLNIEKNIYRWVNCLVKYGDLYLRFYHESEYDNLLSNKSQEKQELNEDLVIKAYNKNDKYVHYLEMINNPAEIFELTKFGKSYAYVQAPVTAWMSKLKDSNLAFGNYTYNFRRRDVQVFSADNFVHAALDDLSTRASEQVSLTFSADEEEVEKYTYNVRRGQSILYNTYKIWRQNMLLEYALLLNRLSRSSVVKIVNVEVGDLPKNQARAKLLAVKSLIEQKSALASDVGMNEYANSGPSENIIYLASHNGQGAVSTLELTSDLNVTGLEDIDLFRKKLYSSLKIPRAYLGDADETGGFDGGTSLSLMSSRYAKTIKRILNTIILAVTDAINILLVDKGLSKYINKFTLRMQPPATREELDRRDMAVNRVAAIQETLGLFNDILEASVRLKILKSLLGTTITDSAILAILDDLIEVAEEREEKEAEEAEAQKAAELAALGMDTDMGADLGGDVFGSDAGEFPGSTDESEDFGIDLSDTTNSEPAGTADNIGELPSPEAIGMDFSQM